MASLTDDDDIEESVQDGVPSKKVQSRDLKSGVLLGKGASSIVYETTWKGKSYARKDFLRVPSDIFEREAAFLVALDDHPNVVRTYGWTVDEGSCSLVVELMDDDLLNLMRKRNVSQLKHFSGPSDASQRSHLIDLHKLVDVFSLGCFFFFCITGGHHPYGEHWLRDANIANGTPDFFLIEEIPEAYYLIKAMLSNDPSKRYISSLCPLRALGFVECRIIIENIMCGIA